VRHCTLLHLAHGLALRLQLYFLRASEAVYNAQAFNELQGDIDTLVQVQIF